MAGRYEKYFVKIFQYGLNYTVNNIFFWRYAQSNSSSNRLCDQLVRFFTAMFILACGRSVQDKTSFSVEMCLYTR